MRQEIAYGENLSLTRRYETELGASSFRIRDVVMNEGWFETPHQLLYHFNIGFPLLDDGAEVLAPGAQEPAGPVVHDRRRAGCAELPLAHRHGTRGGVHARGLHRADATRAGRAGRGRRGQPARSAPSSADSASGSATTRASCPCTSPGG